MQRQIITTIDSLAELLADYARIPKGGRPVRLRRDTATNLLALDLEAPGPIYERPVLSISFRLVPKPL